MQQLTEHGEMKKNERLENLALIERLMDRIISLMQELSTTRSERDDAMRRLATVRQIVTETDGPHTARIVETIDGV